MSQVLWGGGNMISDIKMKKNTTVFWGKDGRADEGVWQKKEEKKVEQTLNVNFNLIVTYLLVSIKYLLLENVLFLQIYRVSLAETN